MKRMIKILTVVACASGMSAAAAQSVQRDGETISAAGKPAQVVAQASPTAPIQVAQASGGAAAGASTGAAAAGGAGLGTGLIIVGAAVATIAVTVDNGSTVTH